MQISWKRQQKFRLLGTSIARENWGQSRKGRCAMTMPTWVRSQLESSGIHHALRHHPPVYSSQELAEIEHISGNQVAKVVVAVSDGTPVLLVLPASRQVNLRKAARLLHKRHLRLASENEIRLFFPDCEVGAIPPLNHWRNVPVVVDNSGFESGHLLFQAGTHEEAILVSYNDWFSLVQPQVADFSEPVQASRHEQDEQQVRRAGNFAKWALALALILLVLGAMILLGQLLLEGFSDSAATAGANSFALATMALLAFAVAPLAIGAVLWLAAMVLMPFFSVTAWRRRSRA
jgi:Ala-tRNA(Pro) deacylase